MGATIEIAGTTIDIASSDDLTKHFADMYDWLLASSLREEIPVPLVNGKTTPAVAFLYTYLDLGGPKPGWLWDIMRLAIYGNDPTAVVAGNVFAFISGNAPADSASIGMYPELVEVSGTIPNVAFYSRQQTIVRPGQHFVVGFKSLPNATAIVAAGNAIQYRDPAAGSPVNTYRRPK
jgi:hypothetical protein